MSARLESVALTDICRQLLDEWQLSPEQIENLAKGIPGECEVMREPQALANLSNQERASA